MVNENHSRQYLQYFKYASTQDMKTPISWGSTKCKTNNVTISQAHLYTTDQEKSRDYA
jgi:hypothetical protein